MAVAVITSFLQITDANGVPYSGATVTVYDAGTTTPKSLFSDAALTVAASNPITCDASGRHDMRYFATGTYKILVKSSASATIFTRDNIDPGAPIGSGALGIANGGTGATTAAGARANLGVPSQTTFDALSTTVSTLSSTVAAFVSQPQGYLTLVGSVVVLTADATSTIVRYTPDRGSICPIYNGSAFIASTFAELSLTLVANHLASTLYDVFIINDSGTIRAVTGPAWNSSTAGSCSRGSGAGTTELTRQSGIYVNANSMTGRYGASTVTVNAKAGTYVGSIFIDAAAGNVTCHRSYGQTRKWGVWNAYNRRSIYLKGGDPTASWTYNTATVRASNNDAANKLTVFQGLAEEVADVQFHQKFLAPATGNQNTDIRVGIGVNSTTVQSGRVGVDIAALVNATSHGHDLVARYLAPPALGITDYSATEYSTSTTTTPTFYGVEAAMLLAATWMG